MNKAQMEMLSVKSAIERTLAGYVSAFTINTPQDSTNVTRFYDVVERYIASMFVSGQIQNNYIVRPSRVGIEVSFTTYGHHCRLDYMLPESLKWTVEKMIPQASANKVEVEEKEDGRRVYSADVVDMSMEEVKRRLESARVKACAEVKTQYLQAECDKTPDTKAYADSYMSAESIKSYYGQFPEQVQAKTCEAQSFDFDRLYQEKSCIYTGKSIDAWTKATLSTTYGLTKVATLSGIQGIGSVQPKVDANAAYDHAMKVVE